MRQNPLNLTTSLSRCLPGAFQARQWCLICGYIQEINDSQLRHFGGGVGYPRTDGLAAFNFAHLSLAAAEILALEAALILNFFFFGVLLIEELMVELTKLLSSFSSD